MKKILLTVILLLVALVVYAQNPPATGRNKIGFDQPAPSLVELQGYTWRYHADGATTGVTLTNVTCMGTAPLFQCEFPFPAFTPGPHSLYLITSNVAGDSVPSPTLNFNFVVTPGAAQNLVIKGEQ